jgi:hypothetical protein
MRTRKFVFAGVTIALLAGGLASCSHFRQGTPSPAKDCTRPGLCEVDVVVKDCSPTTNEKILVDKSGGAVEIRWNAPAGYVFTAEGIRFEGTSPVIDPKPGLQERGTRWMVVDRPNGQRAVAKYRIQVQSTSGTVCTGPDPFIANE